MERTAKNNKNKMGQFFDKVIGCVSWGKDFCSKGKEIFEDEKDDNSIDINEKYMSDNKFVNINQYIIRKKTSDYGSMERLDKLIKEEKETNMSDQ